MGRRGSELAALPANSRDRLIVMIVNDEALPLPALQQLGEIFQRLVSPELIVTTQNETDDGGPPRRFALLTLIDPPALP